MEELVVSKEELVKLFEDGVIEDSGRGWLMEGYEIEIVALHDVDPKFLQDVANAKFYKLIQKGR